ncbi:MAG: hypothetical protein HON94_02065 [Methylococcales bacterium]|jgi:hypothetical protein|nr:hypothetical protein [Methylococcales bacterium]MBT7409963.1 hypothetical protein [Methylococcales bacterium]
MNSYLSKLFCSILLLSVYCSYGLAKDTNIIPADVLTRIIYLQQNMDNLRLFMGKPKTSKPWIVTIKVQPRSVYFQAQSLLVKANQLSLEQTGIHIKIPAIKKTLNIRSKDVFETVNLAMGLANNVKYKYKIPTRSTVQPQAESTSSNQVYTALVSANQQINYLLDHPVSSSEVFQTMEEALFYLRAIIEIKLSNTQLADKPVYIRNKTPRDVFFLLFESLKQINILFSSNKLNGINVQLASQVLQQQKPGDVNDLAKVVLSEIKFLYDHFGLQTKYQGYYPGRKFPSDVYQQVNWLHLLLNQAIRDIKQ